MKTNKNLIKSTRYLCLALLIGGATSCGDELEKFPSNAFAQEAFWTSEANANIALTGMYRGSLNYNVSTNPSDWWSYTGIVFLEHATDNAYDRRGDNANQNRLTNGTLLPNNGVLSNYWEASYRRVTICNDFLQNIDKVNMDKAKIDRMKAEARFLRATQYFYLSQYFGSVPLVTKTLTPEEANNVDKAPKSEVVQFVIAEMTAAAAVLPAFGKLTSGEIGRASKQVALGFLGRIQLSEKKYAEASAAFKEIMDMGENKIDPDYRSIFLPSNENSSENIFSVQYQAGLAPNGLPQHTYPAVLSGWHIVNPTGSLADAYGFADGTPLSYSDPRFSVSDMGKNRDPRFRYNLLYDGTTFGGRKYVCHPDSTQSLDQLTYSKQATRTGYGLRKFFSEDFSGNLRNDYGTNFPIIRYAEVLLSYLEAELEGGKPITQELLDKTINAVRTRPSVNLPPLQAMSAEALRPLMRNERRIELAFEGHRLWDIFRWKIGEEVLTGDFWGAPFPNSTVLPAATKKRDPTGQSRWFITAKNFRTADYVWPIPQSEIDVNPKLAQ